MESTELNRIDYALMKILKSHESVEYFKGMTIQEMISIIGISRSSAYRRLNVLVEQGYIQKACKSVNADTFYITEKGINLIEIIKGAEENAEG